MTDEKTGVEAAKRELHKFTKSLKRECSFQVSETFGKVETPPIVTPHRLEQITVFLNRHPEYSEFRSELESDPDINWNEQLCRQNWDVARKD